MKYKVVVRFRGEFSVNVEAKTTKEAQELAEALFESVDFGEIEIEGGEAYSVENENGVKEYYW